MNLAIIQKNLSTGALDERILTLTLSLLSAILLSWEHSHVLVVLLVSGVAQRVPRPHLHVSIVEQASMVFMMGLKMSPSA